MGAQAGLQAVILAGGKGARLLPYTLVLPKPLMPIKDKPVLEVVIRQLKRRGFTDICIATGHLSELIEAFFKDGSKYGVRIRYSIEDAPLGTAGPIGLVRPLAENFLVMNGDLLTTLDYRAMFEFHVRRGAAATIAACRREVAIDYGTLEIGPDGDLIRYKEKPRIGYTVSMGINVLSRRAAELIPPKKPIDIPELMMKLVERGERVLCYTPDCLWLDIGRVDDYRKAVEIYERREKEFIPG